MKRSSSSRKSLTDFERLRKQRDEDVVVDDESPEWTDEMFARAVVRVGLTEVPRKTLLSLRIDSDVLAWFRAQGPGYQSRMNALLRAYMEAAKKSGR